MMAPYLLRLLCLCLAAFFVIHTVVGLLVALSGPTAVRAARRMRPFGRETSAGPAPPARHARPIRCNRSVRAQLPLAGA